MIRTTAILLFALNVQNSTLHGWSNWSGTASCGAPICIPASKEQLINFIKGSASQGPSLHVIGAGHSFNDCACQSDCLISLQCINKVLSLNNETNEVEVEAGIYLNELMDHLAKHKVTLPNLPATDVVTVGGALSTGTHGTGHTGSLSSFVTKIRLITADGTEHILTKEKDAEAFYAALLSLGALGVIYAVTFKCCPLFKVHAESFITSFENILNSYKEMYDTTDFFRFHWQIATGLVTCHLWTRVADGSLMRQSAAPSYYNYEIFPYARGINPCYSTELAVPIDRVPDALFAIQELAKKWAQRGDHVAEVVVRFAPGEAQTLLNMAHVDSAYININMPQGSFYGEVFNEFEQCLKAFGGRPHWGKINFLSTQDVKELYGDQFERFLQVKKRLDPNNVFRNTYTKRVLGF